MGKFYNEGFRLQGRITENTSDEEDLKFIKQQLKNKSQAQLIRDAITTYRKHLQGDLYQEKIAEKLESVLKNANINIDDKEDDNLDQDKVEKAKKSALSIDDAF